MVTRIKKNAFAMIFAVPALVLVFFGGAYALDNPSSQAAASLASVDNDKLLIPGDHSGDVEQMVPCCFQCISVCGTYGPDSPNCLKCENVCVDCAAPDTGESTSEGDATQRACDVTAGQ